MGGRHASTRLGISVAVLSIAIGVLLVAPAVSSAGLIKDLFGGQPEPQPAPQQQPDPYQPPVHGENPHGQGTAGTVDSEPSEGPVSGDPDGGDSGEELVLGRSRGEQDAAGEYHGHVTALALLGNEIVGVDTGEGETAASPFDPVQQGILNQLCQQSNGSVCLAVLQANSTTTATGSENHFEAATISLGMGPNRLGGSFASSTGNISEDPSTGCQTAHGASEVAGVGLAGGGTGLGASGISSSSDSTACPDGTSSQQNTSMAAGLTGPPAVPSQACADGVPDTVTDDGSGNAVICNADDSNGVGEPAPQLAPPFVYGVREALTVFTGDGLLKSVTAASESVVNPHFPVIPPPPPPPPPEKPVIPDPEIPGTAVALAGPVGEEGCRRGVSLGELAPPDLSNTVNVRHVDGLVSITIAGTGLNFCLGGGSIQIPVGSIIDVREGRIELVSEGSIRSSEFYDGIFQVLQATHAHAATVLKLIGPLANCDGSDPEQPRGRQLWGDGDGLHRTQGARGSASVRGTKWLVQDRCDGSTLTTVVRGLVDVRDFSKDETVKVKAGDSYVAGP